MRATVYRLPKAASAVEDNRRAGPVIVRADALHPLGDAGIGDAQYLLASPLSGRSTRRERNGVLRYKGRPSIFRRLQYRGAHVLGQQRQLKLRAAAFVNLTK